MSEYQALYRAWRPEKFKDIYGQEPITQTLKNQSGQLSLEKDKIYRTPVITLNLYDLVTEAGQIEKGDYVLAYHDGTQFKLFSFEQTMANAVDAAKIVEDVHGLSNLLAKASQVYAKVLGGNYVTVSGEAGALAINVPSSVESKAVIAITGNAEDAKTTFTGGGYSLGIDRVITTINSNYTATLAVQPSAPDAISIMYGLRGGTVTITFDDLIDFAVSEAQKDGITFTEAQLDRLRSGFNKLCQLAKEELAEHNMGNLMDITLSTNVFDVIAQYYDNAADYSLQLSEEKKFGWATPVGFYKGDDGFTANVALPSSGWFDRIDASLAGDTDAFIAYWAEIDKSYNILDFKGFFEKLARKAVSEFHGDTYALLQQINFSAIGNVYARYANRFNDTLEPVYLYKKQ